MFGFTRGDYGHYRLKGGKPSGITTKTKEKRPGKEEKDNGLKRPEKRGLYQPEHDGRNYGSKGGTTEADSEKQNSDTKGEREVNHRRYQGKAHGHKTVERKGV